MHGFDADRPFRRWPESRLCFSKRMPVSFCGNAPLLNANRKGVPHGPAPQECCPPLISGYLGRCTHLIPAQRNSPELRLQSRRLGWLKLDFSRLRHAVRAAMVCVNLHEQRAAIRVPKPCRHGRDIHAGLDCGRCEGVTQIVMRQTLHAEFLACPREGLPCLANASRTLPRGSTCATPATATLADFWLARIDLFKQRPGRRDQRNLAVCGFSLASPDAYNAPVEVHVGPSHALRLAQPTSSICQEAAEIGGITGHPAARRARFQKRFPRAWPLRAASASGECFAP